MCFASPGWADFYRYVDKDGKKFFTNDLKQVPQEYLDSAIAGEKSQRLVNRR